MGQATSCGSVQPIPLSAWGLVSSPCVIGGVDIVTGNVMASCGGAPATSSGGTSSTQTVTMALAAYGVGLLLLYAVFAGGE